MPSRLLIASLILAFPTADLSVHAAEASGDGTIVLAQYVGPRTKHREKQDTIIENKITSEIATKQTIKITSNTHTQRCEANASLFFTQMDNQVRVKTLITPKDCPSARGNYTIFMRTADTNGEVKMSQHAETWQNGSESDEEFQKYYPMDDAAIELKSLYLKRLSCICDPLTDTTNQAQPQTQTQSQTQTQTGNEH